MRLAIVSDIHGNLLALEAVVADFEKRGGDAVINLGDSLSGPMLPRETAAYLRATDWVHLAGNHERQIIEAPHAAHADPADTYACTQLDADVLAWIASLRDTQGYASGIFLCHASPRSDIEYLLETVTANGIRLAASDEIEERLHGRTEALVLCGHTHRPRSVRLGAQLIVNPGSVGLPAFDDERPYFHRIENGSPDARYAIVEHGVAGWSTDLVSVPYDFEPMARLADERGMPEWAYALRHGRMPG
jgi:predicted phosphodiesterase